MGIAIVSYCGASHFKQKSRSRAFSILELLVGFAVLSLLVVILLVAFSNFSQVTSNSKKRLEVNKQSRTIFDRMAFDINSAVTSGGVKLGFRKNDVLPGGTPSKNDVMVVLTDAKTRDPDGRLAKVGYGVAPYEDRSRAMTYDTIFRYVEPFRWDDDTTQIALTNAADSQPIAPGILRFELAFVDQNGVIIAAPPAAGASEEVLRAFYENLSAIICTVATLDEDSLQKLTDTQRKGIADRLGDAVDGQAPLTVWQSVGLSDLPLPVTRGLRFHQRYFRLK